uniref:Uncharacterized protein n=1 Tax=Aegilops tauschii subsp. strangulata TaxID=200361 RepID=A0A453RCB0_AEGTS
NWYHELGVLGVLAVLEAWQRWRRSPAAARWSSGPCVGLWRWAALWLPWRVAEAAGGDVVRAATAEAAEALRGGAAAQHGVAAWRCCAAVEATAVQGNKPWRRARRDRCVLWVRTGRVGRVGTTGARTSVQLTLGGGIWTWRRRAVSVWCGRARRARRVRAGRTGYTGAVRLVGRVGCVRDVRGAEGRQACVAGEEG